jgi:hypothetical protein
VKYLYKSLFLALILPLFSLAQSNYKPGYVVTLKGDTLHGFIDYREWNSNPVSINFKTTTADNKIRKFSSEAIDFFSIDGLEEYKQYSGPVSTDATDANHINEGIDSSFRTATIFLKVLQKGNKVSFFSYADDIKTRFYIKEGADPSPKELIYRLYFIAENANTVTERRVTMAENTYMRQLYSLAQKNNLLTDALQLDIEHSGYNKSDILKIVSKINGISKTEYQKAYADEAKLNLFVGAGVNITSTIPSGSYQTAGGTSYTSYGPEVSFGINFFANPNTGKLIFRTELMLGEGYYRSAYTNKVSPYVPISYKYDQLEFSIVPQIIYNFYNATNFKVYAGIGAAVTFYKYSNALFSSQDGKTPVAQIIQDNPYFFSPYNTLIMLKGGMQFTKKWGIFVDYLTTAPVTRGPYFVLNYSTLQAGINYSF